MDAIDFWKLCSHYSVVQAALLICGSSPDSLQYDVESNDRSRPHGYVPTRTALEHAIRTGTLEAEVVEYSGDSFDEPAGINLHRTLIHWADLNRFLKSKGVVSAFFDRETGGFETPPRQEGPYFPRKLDAAIKAWTAVTSEPERLKGRSPKQALEAWLIEHAAELGLLNKDGAPNRNGIEEICKVANWKPEGGATPTPGSAPSPRTLARPTLIQLPDPPRNTPAPTAPRETFATDLDDEIPF